MFFGVVRRALMAFVSLEELGGATSLLEELAAMLLEDAALLLEGGCAALEEAGACSLSLGT